MNAQSVVDDTITTNKLTLGAVTADKIADNAIATLKIADGQVTSSKIPAEQVVKSINNLTDAVTLAPGANVTITLNGSTLTIATTVSGDGHSLDAADGSQTDALFVDNDGKVGVGTTSPAANLDVVGTLNATNFSGSGAALTDVVKSINVNGNALKEDISLAAGSNVTITLNGNTLTIAATGTGDITGVSAGVGLADGGTEGDVTLNVGAGEKRTHIQQRKAGGRNLDGRRGRGVG